MIPISPLSIKFTDEERARIKTLASSLGWTESQVVRDSVDYVHRLIHAPDATDEPKLISLARLALCHEENPALLQRHIKKLHLAPRFIAKAKNR